MQSATAFFILCAVCVIACTGAFSFPSSNFMTSVQNAPKLRATSPRRRNDIVCELTKIEEKSVQRMTKQFDKLCKTCPTRLQPRVDTITEMIVNLEEKERLEIFANVEMRLSNMDMEAKGDGEAMVGTVMMTNGMMKDEEMSEMSEDEKEEKKMKMKEEKMKMKDEKEMKMGEMEKKRMKLEGKIAKNTMKLEEAKQKLALVTSLDKEPGDEMMAKEVMELREKSAEELEIYALKAQEKVFKYERKLAECRLKLKMLADPALATC
mmetsp:Transcript_34864/g.82134  ORF Transcript_34864/g.82134 Transcript_34864/m.82134 type:complete len:265 (-) Transcript_34864:150-944(-)